MAAGVAVIAPTTQSESGPSAARQAITTASTANNAAATRYGLPLRRGCALAPMMTTVLRRRPRTALPGGRYGHLPTGAAPSGLQGELRYRD